MVFQVIPPPVTYVRSGEHSPFTPLPFSPVSLTEVAVERKMGERSGAQKSSACDPHSLHMYSLVLARGGVEHDFVPTLTDLDYLQRLRECIESQECSECEQ